MPTIILALNYWLHLLASVIWLGGLAMLTLVAWPEMRGRLTDGSTAQEELIVGIERRFRPLANISLIVLLVTGMLQMGGDPHYEGFLAITNTWSATLLAKHCIIVGMLAITAVLQWGVHPALDRARLAAQRSEAQKTEAQHQHNRLRVLTAVNLGLGLLVLVLTAYMTAL